MVRVVLEQQKVVLPDEREDLLASLEGRRAARRVRASRAVSGRDIHHEVRSAIDWCILAGESVTRRRRDRHGVEEFGKALVRVLRRPVCECVLEQVRAESGVVDGDFYERGMQASEW